MVSHECRTVHTMRWHTTEVDRRSIHSKVATKSTSIHLAVVLSVLRLSVCSAQFLELVASHVVVIVLSTVSAATRSRCISYFASRLPEDWCDLFSEFHLFMWCEPSAGMLGNLPIDLPLKRVYLFFCFCIGNGCLDDMDFLFRPNIRGRVTAISLEIENVF